MVNPRASSCGNLRRGDCSATDEYDSSTRVLFRAFSGVPEGNNIEAVFPGQATPSAPSIVNTRRAIECDYFQRIAHFDQRTSGGDHE